MKRCKKCVLPETFLGIKFNDEGICNFCLNFKGEVDLIRKKKEYRQKFEKLIKKYKGKSSYDALMSYSGGKDSTYVLYILKNSYNLNTLAVTFDNGFLPEQTLKNIRNIVENLGTDHIFFKPNFNLLKKIFNECAQRNIFSSLTLSRASTICTACMALVKFSALRLALEKSIPFIVFGWSPGQIPIKSSVMKNNPQIIKIMQKTLFDPLYNIGGEKIKPYFLDPKHFKEKYFSPYNISPFSFLEYNEEEILKKISKLEWQAPLDVDAHSTNCQLNSLANVIHKKKYGFHPYVFELANLVREGYLDRNFALHKLAQKENSNLVALMRKKLNLFFK